MSHNKLKKVVLFIIVFSFTIINSCTNENVQKEYILKIKDATVNKKVDADSNTQVLKESEDVKAIFNIKTQMVQLKYQKGERKQIFNIGRYSNTFGDPPKIETINFGKNNIGIVIITNIVQMGQSADNIAIYIFNKKRIVVKKLFETTEVAVHDMEIDTMSNIIHYDYLIDTAKEQLIINEYIPFKSLVHLDSKYLKKTQKFKLQFPDN